jgi:predicted lipoprotein with Yx(FWY)xxD motif
MMKIVLAFVLIALTNQNPLIIAVESNAGKFITDFRGFPLYVYTLDSPGSGVSTCYDYCAYVWPPLTVEQGTIPQGTSETMNGRLSTLTRIDGTLQVTYNGWPLYYHISDKIRKNVGSQGIIWETGFWWVLSLRGEPITTAPKITPYFRHKHYEDHSTGGDSKSSILLRSVDSDAGRYITNHRGMALYVLSVDVPGSGVSVCYDLFCPFYWPPVIIQAGTILKGESDSITSKMSYIIRTDNHLQLAYNGWPLHYYIGDLYNKNVGNQGFITILGNQWSVISEEGNPITSIPSITPYFNEEEFTTEHENHHH